MLLQIFLRNFYSNASCFSLVWLYLGNSQVSVDRTIGPTLVLLNPFQMMKKKYENLFQKKHIEHFSLYIQLSFTWPHLGIS